MADVETFMGISAADIEKIMGVAKTDIEAVMGYGFTPPEHTDFLGSRGVVFGGAVWGVTTGHNVIQYKAITSTGNATDFGDMSDESRFAAAVSDGSRGVTALGENGENSNSTVATRTNILEYVTIGSTGNTSDFGDLSVTRTYVGAGGNGTVGLWFNGFSGNSSSLHNDIDYVTIGSTGNASDWGDTTNTSTGGRAVSNANRVVMNIGYDGDDAGANVVTLDYVSTASTGNASDFGDLTVVTANASCCESASRGVWMGGSGPIDVIHYITVASAGDASDFGDLDLAVYAGAGTGNGTKGEMWGGDKAALGFTDRIEYITIASTGNGTDSGNMLDETRNGTGACSGS